MLAIEIPEKLEKRMKEHPEVDWRKYVLRAIDYEIQQLVFQKMEKPKNDNYID